MAGHRLLPRFALRRARPLAALAAIAAMLASAGGAAALDDPTDPSVRWPVGGPAVRTALAIAEEHWGVAPCHGALALAWEDLDPSLDAQAVWGNDVGAYADPLRNTGCQISFNPRGQWDWPKLCTIMVHEVGHLDGRDHVDDPADVMYYTYTHPLQACADTAEPVAAAPPPAALPIAAPRSTDGSRATAARRRPATKRRTSRPAAKRQRRSAVHRRGAHRT